MHVADIRVWADPLSGRGCFVHVEEDTCELELRALGARVLTVTCPSVDAALATADEWRPTYLPRRERRRIQLAGARSLFGAGSRPRSLGADRRRSTRPGI
jgi:hypothetical protein